MQNIKYLNYETRENQIRKVPGLRITKSLFHEAGEEVTDEKSNNVFYKNACLHTEENKNKL